MIWCDVNTTELAISANVGQRTSLDCICTEIYLPVCAELNGEEIDYGNECFATCAYVSLCTCFSLSVCLSLSVCVFTIQTGGSGISLLGIFGGFGSRVDTVGLGNGSPQAGFRVSAPVGVWGQSLNKSENSLQLTNTFSRQQAYRTLIKIITLTVNRFRVPPYPSPPKNFKFLQSPRLTVVEVTRPPVATSVLPVPVPFTFMVWLIGLSLICQVM